jgi:hypothetical protein
MGEIKGREGTSNFMHALGIRRRDSHVRRKVISGVRRMHMEKEGDNAH